MSNTDKQDIYSRVTDKILADMAKGELTWRKPWSGNNAAGKITRPLRANGIPYQGINIVMLWHDATIKGFSSPYWMTFKQALDLGGNVRKGEKSSLVVYADKITRTEQNDKGEDIARSIPFMKGYAVFNVEQCENLPAHYSAVQPSENLQPVERIERLDRFFTNTGATIRHGGNQAFYAPGPDLIQMPPYEAFKDPESYYATLAHETTHWTKAPQRLDRDFKRQRFGDEGYAREELVAELGSAFLCADLGITPETREDHAAYIQHWAKVLKDDKRFIFTAAAHATRAAEYLHSLQQPAVTDTSKAA
ncbi:MAG: ArdC family protein [Burkholderiaceae bacterium]